MRKSRSGFLLLYYNIIIILFYTILHFLEGLNVTKSHVTKAQMASAVLIWLTASPEHC